MKPWPTWPVTSPVPLPPIPTPVRTVRMQHRNDHIGFRINDKHYSIHALPIGRGNAVGQPIKLPAADHERPTPAAYKRTAVSIGIDCLHDSDRNPAHLCPLACMIGQDRWWHVFNLHAPVLPLTSEMPLLKYRDGRRGKFLTLRGIFFGVSKGGCVARVWPQARDERHEGPPDAHKKTLDANS